MLKDKNNTEENREFLRLAYELIPMTKVADKMGMTRAALSLRLLHGKDLKLEDTFEALLDLGLEEKVDLLKSRIRKLKKEL